MSDPLYYTSASHFKEYANSNYVEQNTAISSKANYYGSRTFVNYDGDKTIRSSFTQSDYDWFRYAESVPIKQEEIISMCVRAYDQFGTISNVIELMSDFSSQGIRFQHPNKRTEKFFNTWFGVVKGRERSERFLNSLYKTGNVIARRMTGKIKTEDAERWRKSIADEDGVRLENIKTYKKEIPLRYIFLSPLAVEMIGGELSSFVGKPMFALRISSSIINGIRKYESLRMSDPVRELIDMIPADIRSSIKNGQQKIILDPSKIEFYSYRKDDWRVWGQPIIAPILDDLIMLAKTKLADRAALDGAISNVRLWNVGFLDGVNSILPTAATINKIRNILANSVGGGTIDLVWGPELTFKESNSNIHNFLGPEKYIATLDQIYDGLGIPPTLRSGGTGNNTASFIALNTLVKRLEYGRNMLVDFWTKEASLVQKAMDIKVAPTIVFDHMVLADEAAIKQIFLNMWDRDIISTETLMEYFGRNPEIEALRVKREAEKRGDGMPFKASPYHNPDPEHDLKKIILQAGEVTPSQLGIELEEKKEGEVTRLDKMEQTQVKLKEMDGDQKIQQAKMKPKPAGVSGRPRNITETKKRKPKPTQKPSTKAEYSNKLVWANSAYSQIGTILNPCVLDIYGKKNLRQLTNEEAANFEYLKFSVLAGFQPFDEITEEKVYIRLTAESKPTDKMLNTFSHMLTLFEKENGRKPKMDELRQIYSSAYISSF